ncbi:unnamed protein product, partial [Staurois parvus]
RCPAVPTHKFRPPVPSSASTCAQQCTHLCPAVRPPVPPSNVTTCAQKCHLPVPSSATHLCPPTCAHQCSPAVLPVSATSHQCYLSVLSISTHYQCCLSVPPICDTSLVLPISAAYQ